ncbi:MAG: AAA family ATPase, partial [Gammaproteobacteria bacterium]|nr:AAA family ATPase [Gammaproteobacteria bacterium]
DLHLRNLAWYQDKPLAFDCLEFNPNFRWIDIISEIAFLIMDLEDHQQAALGQRFLNQYLEISGDYAGCRVLNFYLVYRAMVRAKVAAIRSQQQGIKKEDMNSAITEFNNYLELALKYTQQHPPFLLITSGVSGSGKSTFSAPISEKLGAIRIRSDVERKRLFNISMELQFQNKIAQGIYSEAATEKTYLKLLELAETLLRAGYPVIVDATFSTYSQRQRFKQLADKSNCRFIILEFIATNKTLQQRITKRKNDISDADLNVLKSQLSHWHALEPTERRYTYAIDTEKPFVLSQLIKDLKF